MLAARMQPVRVLANVTSKQLEGYYENSLSKIESFIIHVCIFLLLGGAFKMLKLLLDAPTTNATTNFVERRPEAGLRILGIQGEKNQEDFSNNNVNK